MQKGKWRKILALLLCVANILGQTVPAMAQEVIPAVAEQGFESTSDVSDNETVLNVQNPSGNDMEDEIKEEGSILAEEGMVSDNTALEETEEVVTPTITVQAEEESTPVNIARGKPTVASSQEADSVRSALAVDGDTSDRNSRWGSSVGGGPHWIYVDLEAEKNVKSVRIYWENRKATEYKIQVASSLSATMQESDWKTVKTLARPAETTDIINFENVEKARYVRLLITSFTKEDPDGGVEWNSVSIYEMEVYEEELEIVQDPSVNVARGKNAYSDSVESNSSFTASKAVDGDTGGDSRWAGAYGTGSPRWIYVDLGRVMDVKTVRIYWETRKAKVYSIQLANELSDPMVNEDWTSVKTMNDHPASTKDTIDLGEVKRARYVRLYIDEFTSEDPGGAVTYPIISLYEMEIYGGEPPVNIPELINFVQPQKGDKKLQLDLPVIEGKSISYNGADYEELVDDDLNIYQPIVDTVVTVNVKISDNEDPKDYQFKEMPITIPGQYQVEAGDNAAPKVLPEVREWKGRTGVYTVSDNTSIVYKEEIFKDAAQALAKDYEALEGKVLPVVQADQADEGDIFFTQTSGKGLLKEGYLMEIGSKITIEAEEYAGAYWATRTILQSIKADGNVPQGITRDYPLYEVRGFILDVGRKTFSMDYLKQVVKEMAWYKMNDFHVHLNDNLIFLGHYSNNGLDPLTAYSGFRLESDIKEGGNNGLNKADLTSKDMFYTKNEFREFIKESRNYGVNIVPEIDTPAHALALTKVRPDLRHGDWAGDNEHLNLVTKYDDSLAFVQSIFDEYMGATLVNPVFDEDTVVHIGCDEYHASPRAFREFSNDMIDYVQEKNRTVRMWGSLTSIKEKENGVILPNQVDVKSENVQMNLWNFGYANWDEMYEEGFELITCNDGGYYSVPNAGYYGDYLDDGTMYNNPVNTREGVTIPAGDDQMLGAAFAVWNDMIDFVDNGVSEYDIYDRIKKPMAMLGSNLWGKDPRQGKALTLAQAKERYEILGSAPGNNFGYKVENTDGVIAHYPMDNAEGLSEAVNAEITEVDGKNALKLNGNESYIKTDLTTVGLDNVLRVKVKRTSISKQEQILFESPYGSIKAVQKSTGRVGFSRENYDYSFNYTLPVNEWVELEFKNQFKTISLYVNGELMDVIGDEETIPNNSGNPRPLLATMMFPMAKIGSETKAFIGYVDDVRLGVNATYNSTMELDYALMLANQVLVPQENEALAALVEQGKALINTFAPKAEDITALVAEIKAEIEKASFEKANYENVDKYLAAIPEDLSIYTKETVDVLNIVKASIRRDLPSSMQSTVDGYELSLAKAINALELIATGNINFVAVEDIKNVTASSEHSGEGPAAKAADGNPNTYWHSNYPGEQPMPHWIQLELKEETSITEVVYLPRPNGGNGNYTGFELKIGASEDTLQTVKSGTWENNPNEKTITLDGPTPAKFIRLVATSSVQNFGSAAEIKLRLASISADVDGLNSLITKVQALEKGTYTDESWNALQEKLQEAVALAGQTAPDANDVEIMKRGLSSAMKNLRLTSTPVDDEEEDGGDEGDQTDEIPDGIWVNGVEDLVYTGAKQTLDIVVYDGRKELTAGKDYTITFKNNQNAYVLEEHSSDEYAKRAPQAVIKMKGDYKGTQNVYFNILPITIDEDNIEVVVDDIYVTGNGKKQTPAPQITWQGKKLSKKDFVVKEYEANKTNKEYAKNPGTYDLTLEGQGNFTGTRPITLTIADKAKVVPMAKVAVKKLAKSVAFGDGIQASMPEGITLSGFEVKDGKVTLKEGEDYQVSYDNNHVVGTATLILEGTGKENAETGKSYQGVKRLTFKITGTAMTKAVVEGLNQDGYIFNGDPIEPEGITAKIPAKAGSPEIKLEQDVHYTISYEKNTAKGTATIIMTGMEEAGYTGVKKTSFKIKEETNLAATFKVIITDAVNPEAEGSKEDPYKVLFRKGGVKPQIEVTYNTMLLTEGKDYTVAYKNNTKVADLTSAKVPVIQVKGKGSFKGTVETQFVILKKDADVNDEVQLTVADKVENLQAKSGWKSNFKLTDIDGKALTKKTDYLAETVTYKVVSLGEYPAEVTDAEKVAVGDTLTDAKQKVPAGSEIEVSVTLTGDSYKGTVSTTYRILKSGYDISKASFKIKDQAYTGAPVEIDEDADFVTRTLQVVKKADPVTLTMEGENPTFEIVEGSYVKNVNKGTAKVTLRGLGEFGGTKTVSFKIGQRDISFGDIWKGFFDILIGKG